MSIGSSAKRTWAPKLNELKQASTLPLIHDSASGSSVSLSLSSSCPSLYPLSARSRASASLMPDDTDHNPLWFLAAGSVPLTPRDKCRLLNLAPAALLASKWAWSGVHAPVWAAVACAAVVCTDDTPVLPIQVAEAAATATWRSGWTGNPSTARQQSTGTVHRGQQRNLLKNGLLSVSNIGRSRAACRVECALARPLRKKT
jgi:hypothetical protein